MWQTREANKPMDEPTRGRSNGTESRGTRSTEREKSIDMADRRQQARSMI